MNLIPKEKEAINQVLKAGRDYGYGNMILHLKMKWVDSLVKKGLREQDAMRAAGITSCEMQHFANPGPREE